MKHPALERFRARFRAAPRWVRITIYVVIGYLVLTGVLAIFRTRHQGGSGSHHSVVAANAQAQAHVNEALGVVAGYREVFPNYSGTNPVGIKFKDHRLRSVPSLSASGNGQTFSVSVRSASGTTFEVSGEGTRLARLCRPVGPGCSNGHWKGRTLLVIPKPPKLTAGQRSQVRSILLESVAHYEAEFAAGKEALGSTQYPNAYAGLAALKEPNSAASKFSTFRKHSNIENDLSYQSAFERADHIFTAANEPHAMEAWRNAMERAWSAIIPWVNDAVSWQIGSVSTSKLQSDEGAIESSLAQARADALQAAR